MKLSNRDQSIAKIFALLALGYASTAIQRNSFEISLLEMMIRWVPEPIGAWFGLVLPQGRWLALIGTLILVGRVNHRMDLLMCANAVILIGAARALFLNNFNFDNKLSWMIGAIATECILFCILFLPCVLLINLSATFFFGASGAKKN